MPPEQSANEEVPYDLSKHSCTANLKGEDGVNTMSGRKPEIIKTKAHANLFACGMLE